MGRRPDPVKWRSADGKGAPHTGQCETDRTASKTSCPASF